MGRRMFLPVFFFSKPEKQRIIASIQKAEQNTSAEIRVHLECRAKRDIFAHAKKVFDRLGMARTRDRNGVLIFLATNDKKFVILGDKGISEKVPDNFWADVAQGMEGRFRKNEFAEGIAEAVLAVGEKLKTFFPYRSDDVNELPDTISY